jgi:predicted transposase/invertase (TIGR01784 family)
VEEYEDRRLAKVYDIEPNKFNPAELPMRSRYSQSLTDVKLLNSGDTYETLPEYISIWILPYDPFGKNCMIYTVKNVVEEFPELLYNDGVKRLFLYVGGELGGTEKLKDLLHYFSSSKKGNVTDAELEHLHSIVEKAKYNQKVGKRYMTLQDMIDYEKKESYEDGKAEGREEGILVLISTLKELNVPSDEILKQLMQKLSLTMEEAKAYLDAN